MGGKSKKQTVGYKYYLGMHQILCHGPIDAVTRVTVDDRLAWAGTQTGGPITINQESLFGGEGREGGVSGTIDIEMGRNNQGKNSYLLSKLGSLIPAYRGVVGAVFRQCYLGNNPYLKAWRFRGQRIHVRQDGIAQWYDAKAAVYPPVLSASSSLWRYLVVSNADNVNRSAVGFDDSSWPVGAAPFANAPWSFPGNYGFATVPATVVPSAQKVWMRTTLNLDKVPSALRFEAFLDNDCRVYVNGVLALSLGGENGAYYDTVLSGTYFHTGANTVAVVGWDRHSGGPPSNWFWFDWRLTDLTSVDMNAIHIIRECLTDPLWGMGYLESDVDDTVFQGAADVIGNEGLGMSLLWDKQIKIEEFVDEVKKHIDAALYVSRSTGKFVVKLIRNDYDPDTLLHLDESNIARIEDPTRTSFGELVNSVTVNYWDATTGKDASLTVTDTAMVQMQGVVINTTVQYPGFTNARNATIAGQRDLKALSSPTLTCTIYADSSAKGLNLGDAFKMSWSRWGISEMVMRVTAIAYGTGKNNQVKISCTQDVYDTNTAVTVNVPGNEWSDPSTPPSASLYETAQEAPYYEVVQVMGQADTDNKLLTHPEIGYVLAAASRGGSAINARMWTDDGTGYEDTGALDFSPTAVLTTNIDKVQTSFVVADLEDVGEVPLGTHFQIGQELLRLDSIDLDTGAITVGRGVLDTVPEAHVAGSALLFWDQYAGFSPTEYVEGETIDVKITPVSGAGVLPLDEASPMTVEITGRAARPYPPGKMQINGESYLDKVYEDELTVTWAHRDRLQQTSGTLLDAMAGDIGPEAGTVYRIQVYGDGVLIDTIDDIAGTSQAVSPPIVAGEVKIEIHSKRDGLYSLYAPWHTFTYTSGGLRFTEEGDMRGSQDGALRITEDS